LDNGLSRWINAGDPGVIYQSGFNAGSASQEIAAAAAEAVSMEIEQEIAVLSARMRFAQEYSAAKGWNFANLKVEQMLEIRDQEVWRTPALPAVNAYVPHEGLYPSASR
jgi:hypothetical protein